MLYATLICALAMAKPKPPPMPVSWSAHEVQHTVAGPQRQTFEGMVYWDGKGQRTRYAPDNGGQGEIYDYGGNKMYVVRAEQCDCFCPLDDDVQCNLGDSLCSYDYNHKARAEPLALTLTLTLRAPPFSGPARPTPARTRAERGGGACAGKDQRHRHRRRQGVHLHHMVRGPWAHRDEPSHSLRRDRQQARRARHPHGAGGELSWVRSACSRRARVLRSVPVMMYRLLDPFRKFMGTSTTHFTQFSPAQPDESNFKVKGMDTCQQCDQGCPDSSKKMMLREMRKVEQSMTEGKA